MVDWLAVRANPIEAVEHGVQESASLFEHVHIGPRSFDRIDYPAAEVLPESTERTDATNWQHTIVTNLYFERGRGLDYVDDILHPTAAVLDNVLAALSELPRVNNYYPASIEDFAGQLDNTQLLLVSIRFQCVTQVDPGDFGD
jgi:hypothetical protein